MKSFLSLLLAFLILLAIFGSGVFIWYLNYTTFFSR